MIKDFTLESSASIIRIGWLLGMVQVMWSWNGFGYPLNMTKWHQLPGHQAERTLPEASGDVAASVGICWDRFSCDVCKLIKTY